MSSCSGFNAESYGRNFSASTTGMIADVPVAGLHKTLFVSPMNLSRSTLPYVSTGIQVLSNTFNLIIKKKKKTCDKNSGNCVEHCGTHQEKTKQCFSCSCCIPKFVRSHLLVNKPLKFTNLAFCCCGFLLVLVSCVEKNTLLCPRITRTQSHFISSHEMKQKEHQATFVLMVFQWFSTNDLNSPYNMYYLVTWECYTTSCEPSPS